MTTEVRVPTLGESFTEVTVATWFKKAGDPVALDEPLCELETDKVMIEVPAPAAGVLSEILAPSGTTVKSGGRLAVIGGAVVAAAPAASAHGVKVIEPKLGESVSETTVTSWTKKVGDTVVQDEILRELKTDKVPAEVSAPAASVLHSPMFYYARKDPNKRVAFIESLAARIQLADVSPFIDQEDKWHTESSADGLVVPIGRANDKKFSLTIGHGTTNYNVLIGGGVGSGKSVLLHNLILGLATRYSTAECELLLLDYKEGTEFKPYEKLPHAKALATSSEPEFGLRLLEFIELEIKRRGSLFKQAGVSNISDYRRVGASQMPRWVVVIDEFQKLLADQRHSSQVEALLDSLVRTGRSFGIHFVLATQSLFDVNLSIATQSNLSVRICLRISEIDASKILSMDNLLPSTFQKPGQAIFNDNNGQIINNTEIQVPFIGSDLQSSTLVSLSKKMAFSPDLIRFEGEQFSKMELSKIIQTHSKSFGLSIGSKLDVQATPHIIPIDAENIDPILILGADEVKKKCILTSLINQIEMDKRFLSINIIDLEEQLASDYFSLNYSKCKLVHGLTAANEQLESLLIAAEPKNELLSVVVFVGVSRSKQLRKRAIDQETFEEKDHPVKAKMIELIKSSEVRALLPIILIDRQAAFATVFESADFNNQVQLDDFPFRVYLDQTAELSYEGVKVTDVSCIVIDSHKGSIEPVILYNHTDG